MSCSNSEHEFDAILDEEARMETLRDEGDGDDDSPWMEEEDLPGSNLDDYDDSMDGDFDSAMASAGFGMNEDYGDYEQYDE